MTPEPWSDLITLDTIQDLYADGIRRFGGKSSSSKEGCVEGSVGNAYTAELYNESEISTPGLCFAGHLLFYLASNHCYVDGNKRIAWTATMCVLLELGLTVDATEDEAETFCIAVADGSIKSGVEVVRWIAPRLQSVDA